MDNGGDILQLCRLCLVKDDVNIPIFEEQGDIRQIFLKISSCLPVKVSWRHPPCYCFLYLIVDIRQIFYFDIVYVVYKTEKVKQTWKKKNSR